MANNFKAGDRVRILGNYGYSAGCKGAVRTVVEVRGNPAYGKPWAFLSLSPDTPNLDSTYLDDLELVDIDEAQQANLTKPQTSMPVCNCKMHGPTGLLAVGCTCGAMKGDAA